MRTFWMYVAVLSVAPLALCHPPSAAQKNDASQKAKRIAEIEKEIGELQARIGKLMAELATLQPPPKPAAGPLDRGDTLTTGEIVKLSRNMDQTTGFWLVMNLEFCLRDDTQIMFSDKTKASAADLEVGQSVTVRWYRRDLAMKRMPALAFACVVVIQQERGGKGPKTDQEAGDNPSGMPVSTLIELTSDPTVASR